MGYACPVCDDPQADAEHLANHLAFTAMLRGDGHETWLDERVDDWADRAPEELAEHVAEHAEEAEFPQVFEDTTGGSQESGHGHDHSDGGQPSRQSPNAIDDAVAGGVADLDDFDGDTDDVLAEARELTRARRENTGDDADGDTSEGGEADSDDETDRS